MKILFYPFLFIKSKDKYLEYILDDYENKIILMN